jgi:hypothetical protein
LIRSRSSALRWLRGLSRSIEHGLLGEVSSLRISFSGLVMVVLDYFNPEIFLLAIGFLFNGFSNQIKSLI